MVNKEPASSSSRQPATLNPDMSREILGLLKAQGLDGVDLDAEALQVSYNCKKEQFFVLGVDSICRQRVQGNLQANFRGESQGAC
jgi:hypothetical protein